MKLFLFGVIFALLTFNHKTSAAIPTSEREALLAIAETGNSEYLKSSWSGTKGTECEWPLITCDENKEHVIRLSIKTLDIGKLDPAIGQFSHLEFLDLGSNRLTSLPVEIGRLKQLTSLKLNQNLLTFLPKEIGQLSSLSVLDLSRNFISDLPIEIIELKNISQFNISYNCLPGNLNEVNANEPDHNDLLAEWLTKQIALPYTFSQKAVCAEIIAIPQLVVVQNEPNGRWIDFISDLPIPIDDEIDYTVLFSFYTPLLGLLNYREYVVASGSMTKIQENVWRIPSENLTELPFVIIFSIDDEHSVTGIKAWKMRASKLPPENDIPPRTDFSLLLAHKPLSSSRYYGSALNLNYPVIAGDPSPIQQIKAIPKLEGMEFINEQLHFFSPFLNATLNPFKVEKSATKTAEYQLNADNLYEFNTSHQRLITAAPALASPDAFSNLLRQNDLNLTFTCTHGRMFIKPTDNKAGFIYSAEASAFSKPAFDYSAPGIYFKPNEHLPNVDTAFHVYFNEQGDLMEQAVHPVPVHWHIFRSLLESMGFTEVSLAQDGVISGVFNQHKYFALFDYRVNELDYESTVEISEILSHEDVNHDGVKDVIYKFTEKRPLFIAASEMRISENINSVHSQVLYLFPADNQTEIPKYADRFN